MYHFTNVKLIKTSFLMAVNHLKALKSIKALNHKNQRSYLIKSKLNSIFLIKSPHTTESRERRMTRYSLIN